MLIRVSVVHRPPLPSIPRPRSWAWSSFAVGFFWLAWVSVVRERPQAADAAHLIVGIAFVAQGGAILLADRAPTAARRLWLGWHLLTLLGMATLIAAYVAHR